MEIRGNPFGPQIDYFFKYHFKYEPGRLSRIINQINIIGYNFYFKIYCLLCNKTFRK